MLECIALGRRYGRKTAVSDLNLMLDAGKIHVLLGENGSGKTTFLKMAAGLLRPSRGQILFQGHPLSWRDRAKISWLSTESVFYDYMRVSDVEQYYADFFPDFDRERFFILTQKLGLTDNPKVRNLSSGSGAMFLPELGISWIDLVQDTATAILLWLQIVMSGFFAVLLARTVLADSRHGGLLSFLLFWLINLACGLGVSGGQRPFPPVRTSACGLVCLRRDLLPGPRSSLLPADRFSRGQEAESAGCLIGHIPILYMELTQTWQNPPFRFATMKKSRSGACKCFRPETHSETEGTIHGRKQRPHPSVPDPVRAAGSFFRRRLGCLHWTDAVSLKIFEIHRSGRFSAQNRPDIFRKKPPELLPFRGFQAVFLTHSSQIYCKYQSSQRWRSSPSGSPPGG